MGERKKEKRGKGRIGEKEEKRKEFNIFKSSILKICHEMISSSISIDVSREWNYSQQPVTKKKSYSDLKEKRQL